jgi:hypothetical protein
VVAHVDEVPAAVETCEPCTASEDVGEEPRVLGDRAVGIPRAPEPELTAEGERAAVHVADEESPMERRVARPPLPAVEVEDRVAPKGGDVSAAREERLELRGQPRRAVPVVVVPLHDHDPACALAGAVALGADRLAGRRPQVDDPRIAREGRLEAVHAVVDDEQLALAPVLLLPVGCTNSAAYQIRSICRKIE